MFYSVIQNQIFEEELDDLRENFALEEKIEVVLQKLIGEFKFFAKPNVVDFMKYSMKKSKEELIFYNRMMVENSYYERDVLIEAYAKDVLAVTVKLLVWSLDRHSYHLNSIQSNLMTLMCTQIDIPYNKKLCDLILEVFMKIEIKNTPSPLQAQDVDKVINCIAP